jgi:hypothetical protein
LSSSKRRQSSSSSTLSSSSSSPSVTSSTTASTNDVATHRSVINLKSTLVVTVQLIQTPTSRANGESDFYVTRIEERWNSRPLLHLMAFPLVPMWWRSSSSSSSSSPHPPGYGVCTWSRRLNGLISYQLSKRLL